MSAHEVIADWIWDEDEPMFAGRQATEILTALANQGYAVIHVQELSTAMGDADVLRRRAAVMTARCELSDLLVTECSCRIHAKSEPRTSANDIVVRFPARFDSNCDNCGRRMREGDPIAKTYDWDYICEGCQE